MVSTTLTSKDEIPSSAAEIERQLQRILKHKEFAVSDRLKEFFRFVVEETIAGRADTIKAYTIAVQVFGRSDDFDAGKDPIVRIQAGKLRRALERYYLVAGADDPMVIDIPKGAYVPVFRSQPKKPSVEDGHLRISAVSGGKRPSLLMILMAMLNWQILWTSPSRPERTCIPGMTSPDSSGMMRWTLCSRTCVGQGARQHCYRSAPWLMPSDGRTLHMVVGLCN